MLGFRALDLRVEIVAAGLAVGESGQRVRSRIDARDLEIGLEQLDLARGGGELALQLLGGGEHRIGRLDHLGEHRALALERGRGVKIRAARAEPRLIVARAGILPLDIVVHARELRLGILQHAADTDSAGAV